MWRSSDCAKPRRGLHCCSSPPVVGRCLFHTRLSWLRHLCAQGTCTLLQVRSRPPCSSSMRWQRQRRHLASAARPPPDGAENSSELICVCTLATRRANWAKFSPGAPQGNRSSSPDRMSDRGLMWVNVPEAPSKPAAVCVGITEPALQSACVERSCERLSKSLASRCHEVGRLVVHHRARGVCPPILLLHLREDAWQHVVHELCDSGTVVQLRRQSRIAGSRVMVTDIDAQLPLV